MGTILNTSKSDLYSILGITQNTMMSYTKNAVIETLRNSFSLDSMYHFSKDDWGFPNTPNLENVPIEAGLQDDKTSRIFIGQAFRYDIRFYPAVLVKAGSFKYVPLSASRNEGFVKYKAQYITDGYNTKIYSVPDRYILAGAYEGSLSIDVLAGDVDARDDIAELISIILNSVQHTALQNAGIVIKPTTAGSPSEIDDGSEKIYKLTIDVPVRTEWRTSHKIDSILGAITFCLDFAPLTDTMPVAPDMTIKTIIQTS